MRAFLCPTFCSTCNDRCIKIAFLFPWRHQPPWAIQPGLSSLGGSVKFPLAVKHLNDGVSYIYDCHRKFRTCIIRRYRSCAVVAGGISLYQKLIDVQQTLITIQYPPKEPQSNIHKKSVVRYQSTSCFFDVFIRYL